MSIWVSLRFRSSGSSDKEMDLQRSTGYQPVLAIFNVRNSENQGLFSHLPANTGWKPVPQ